MARFYSLLWLHWALRLTLCSIVLACGISFVITTSLYISQGAPSLNDKVLLALFDLFTFWFAIMWSITLLIALFRGMKFIFNRCHAGFTLKLLACEKQEYLQSIGYGDLVRVWRKWLMLLIWLVASEMVLAIIFTKSFTNVSGVFEWFSIYWLFTFILIAGYFSFIILGSRCKKVKIIAC